MRFDSVFRQELFAGQVGIVTGGGSGIGRCIAHELASLGATVVLSGRNSSKLERTAAEITEAGGRAEIAVANVRDEDEVKALVGTTVSRHGRLNFLVNNAGGQFAARLESISLKGWNAVLETNLTGIFLMSREAIVQHMAENGGAIVNIVADMWNGMPMMGHSGAARAGVVNLTRTGALEWAPYRVRVNAVAPGLIQSSGFDTYPEEVQGWLNSLPPETPAKRFGSESEVSSAVTYLLSPAAAYVTGETLRVDGASSIYRRNIPVPDYDPEPPFSAFLSSSKKEED